MEEIGETAAAAAATNGCGGGGHEWRRGGMGETAVVREGGAARVNTEPAGVGGHEQRQRGIGDGGGAESGKQGGARWGWRLGRVVERRALGGIGYQKVNLQ